MDRLVKDKLIDSYQIDGGFIVHDRKMLERVYLSLGIDPKVSLDTRILELEGVTHFFQHGIISLAKKLGITRDDHVLSLGDGSGGPSRLLAKMFGCKVTGIDINPNQVKKAKEFTSLHGVQDKVEYCEQNVEELSLLKKDFTKAFCNETCGHWQEKEKALRRIHIHIVPKAKIGFNAWLKGDKGTLNDAYGIIPEFRHLYKRGIWFQEDLNTYRILLEQAGFNLLEMYDCTNRIDIKMRARVIASQQWERYEKIMGREARDSGLNYYEGMLKTHFDFLRYGVIIAEKLE